MAAKEKKNPQEDLKKLKSVIDKGEFKNIHLLFGLEDYLRNQMRDTLVNALTGGEKTMNFDRFTGKDVMPGQIIDLAETLPFFSEKRVILLEDTGWLKSSCEEFANYIKGGICDSTYIVISEKEVDKRGMVYKAIDAVGMISEFGEQEEMTLVAWTTKKIKDAGLNISAMDVRYMLEMVGTDMVSISNEIEKLTSYCMGKGVVAKEDIDAICSKRLEKKVFEMCDCIALKRQKAAFSMYYELVELKESPIGILAMIIRHYDTLMQIKDLELRRMGDNAISSKVGRPPWSIKNYRAQTSHYTLNELKSITKQCASLDADIKSGIITPEIGLETLIVKLTQ